MRIAIALVLAAAPALAQRSPLPYEPARDLTISGVAGLGWFVSQIFEKQLAPSSCRWCDPPGFDSSIRDALRWGDTKPADTASNVLAYGGMPLATLGVDFLASGADWRVAGTDALIAAESALVAGFFDQMVKFAAGRERPFVHALDPSQKGSTDKPADNNVSFYSGHTSFTMAVAVSTATCASMRGEKSAWAVWATGVPLSLFTGYLRIAADKHYASDVLTGAAMGALFGAGVPLLFHRPSDSPSSAQASFALSPRAFSLAGHF